MKNALKILIFSIVFLGLFYFALFSLLTASAPKIDVDKKFLSPYKSGAIFRFEKIEPHITLTEIGYKISGIEEEYQGELIKYNNPLFVTFNPFLLNFYLSYKGNSEIKNSYGKFLADLDFEQSFVLHLKFSTYAALFRANYNLIKYIKLINIDVKKFAIKQDNSNNEIFQINDSYLSFKTKFKKYSNFDDLISNLPKSYSLSGFVNMKSKLNNPLLNFNSLLLYNPSSYSFYGPFFIQLDSESQRFDYKKPLENSKIRFVCNGCKTDLINFNGEIKTHIKNDSKIIESKCDISLSPDFYENLPSWYHNLVSVIKGFSKNSAQILENPKSKFSTEILTSNYFLDFFIEYSLSDENLSAKIPYLTAKSKETGVSINGDFKFTNDFDYKLESSIILLNARRITDFWTRFFIKNVEMDNDISESGLSLHSDINYNFLKSLSEYPKSLSKDLMLNLKFDSIEDKHKIGSADIFDILNKYFEIKTNVILQNAKKSDNPLGYIKKNVPELSEQTILDLLSEQETNIISDKKWEKLIE